MFRATLLLSALCFLGACTNAKPYNKDNFSMVVDRNWFLDQDQRDEQGRHIIVEGPHGARIEIYIAPTTQTPDLEKIAKVTEHLLDPDRPTPQKIRPNPVEPIEGYIGDQKATGIRMQSKHKDKTSPEHVISEFLTAPLGEDQKILVICVTPIRHEPEHRPAFERMLRTIRVKS